MSYEKLKDHIGHKLTVFNYSLGVELTIECEKCHVVLMTEGRPDIDATLDGEELTVNVMKGYDVWATYMFTVKPQGNEILIFDVTNEDGGSCTSKPDELHKALFINDDLKSEVKNLDLMDKLQEELAHIGQKILL